MTRQELIKNRLFTQEYFTKKEWWGMNETILTSDEIKKEPLVVRKALAIKHVMCNMPAGLKDYELIVGLPNMASSSAGREFPDFALPEEKEEALHTSCMTYKQFGGLHPGDYSKVLRLGIKGIKADIYAQMEKEVQKAEVDEEKMNLWRAMIISLDSVVELAHRYADLCMKEANKTKDPVRAKELIEMSGICMKVPENPAEGFHEALQSFWFFYTALHSCMDLVACGRTDQYLYPYYKMDIESGKITEEYARELVTSFLAKFTERTMLNKEHWEMDHLTPIDDALSGTDPEELPKFSYEMNNTASYNYGTSANHWMMNMMLGGVTPTGEDGTNDLTYMILEQWHYLEIVSPVMSVRIHKNSPKKLIELVAGILRNANGEPAIYNDDGVIAGMVKAGIPLEDARDYCNDGCWEVLVQGKTNYIYEHVHALRILEYTLMRGRSLVRNKVEWEDLGDPAQYKTFDEFYAAYMSQIKYMVDSLVTNNIKHRMNRYKINPSVLLSTIMDDCVAKGADIFNKGTRYTIYGLYLTGFSHAVDSLAAIKKMVYEEKRITMTELVEALKNDYAGQEDLRQMMLNEVPKYGNAEPYVDEIAARFMRDYAQFAKDRNAQPDVKELAEPGYLLSCAAGTFEHYDQWGRACGASADGRHAEQSVASNYSPSLGLDKNGPTATIKSACYPDILPYYSGGPVDITINPNEIQGEEGVQRLSSIIDSFRELGGMLMTLQCLNVDTLKDAQIHPEKHLHLRVRLGGLSVYFIQLAKEQQDIIIRRAKENV